MSSHPPLSVLEATAMQTMLTRIQKQDWNGAHEIAQSQEGVWAYDRLHAFLHRLEGDTANAAYWYRRCGLSISNVSANEEIQFLLQWVKPFLLTDKKHLHVAQHTDWKQQEEADFFIPESLELEGFIHLCTPSQLSGVLERYYAGRTDLYILHIEPQTLMPHLKFEKGPTGDFFPHFFAKLPKSAISLLEDLSL